MKITISKENYVKTIAEAESEGEQVIAATLVRWLNVSAPAVAMAIRRLKRDALIRLDADGAIALTTRKGTVHEQIKPKLYDWIDPAYAFAQSSIVECNRNLLAGLRGEAGAETTAADNLKTLQLVFAAYESAREKSVVRL